MNQFKRYFSLLLSLALVLFSLLSLAQVEKMKGPYDVHYINELLIGSDSRIFLSSTSGLYKSDDFGIEWEKVNASFNNIYLEPVLAKGATGILYVAGRDNIHYSEDNGDSWKLLSFLQNGSIIKTLYVKSDTLFIGTDKGLHYSVNKKWETQEFIGLKGKEIVGIRSVGSALLVATKNQFLVSTDRGNSWTNHTPLKDNLHVTDLEVFNKEIYLGTMFNGLLLTNDLGRNWHEKNDGIGVQEDVVDLFQTESTIYLLSGRNLYASGTGMPDWKVITGVPQYGSQHTAIVAKDNQILVGSWYGLSRSTDAGQSWSKSVSGITDANIVDVKMSEDSTLFVLSPHMGIYQKKKSEESFTLFKSLGGSGGFMRELLLDNNLLYVLGAVVQAYDVHTSNLVKSFKWDQNLTGSSSLVKAGDEYFIATFMNGIWKYTIQEEWVQFNRGLPTQRIHEISLAGSKLYAVTDKGIFSTAPGEEAWQHIDVAGDPAEARKLLVNGETIVAAIGANTYVSNDFGSSWTKLKVLENNWVYDIAYQKDELFVATYNKVFVSKDRGRNWRILYKLEPFSFFQSLLPVGNQLYIGTTENGIFKINTNKFEPKITIAQEDGSVIGSRISFSNATYMDKNSVRLNIHNNGNDTLVLGSPPVIIEGMNALAFSFAELSANQKIAPYATSSFVLSFTPTSFSEYEGVVKVVSNDKLNSVLTLEVHGKADVLASVDKNLTEEPIKIVPNPVKGKARLLVPEELKNSVFILRDATGKQLNTQKFSYHLGAYEWDTTGLPQGMYILTIISESKVWSGKFLKE